MAKGEKRYRWKNLVVSAGTEKGAIKKLRKLVASAAVEAEFEEEKVDEQRELTRDQLRWLSETMMARHHWYVELVVRSQVGSITGDYTDGAIQGKVRRVQTPDGKEHVEYGAGQVILMSGKKEPGTVLITYPRVPDYENGRMKFTYEVNDAL